jgi:hypothetical protein
VNRQQTVIEKYLRNEGKIVVIPFWRIQFFPHFTTSWISKLRLHSPNPFSVIFPPPWEGSKIKYIPVPVHPCGIWINHFLPDRVPKLTPLRMLNTLQKTIFYQLKFVTKKNFELLPVVTSNKFFSLPFFILLTLLFGADVKDRIRIYRWFLS